MSALPDSAAPATAECWWLSPSERLQVQPELRALERWHPAPEHAIAARAGCTIGSHGPAPWRQSINAALTMARLRVCEPTDAEVVIFLGEQAPVGFEEEFTSRTHLPITASPTSASVGPIVMPGRTACLRCLALHQRDADPDGRRATDAAPDHASDPVLAMVAVTAAVAMLRQWIDAPETVMGRRIDFQIPDLRPREKQVHAHPGCGCLWR